MLNAASAIIAVRKQRTTVTFEIRRHFSSGSGLSNHCFAKYQRQYNGSRHYRKFFTTQYHQAEMDSFLVGRNRLRYIGNLAVISATPLLTFAFTSSDSGS